MSYATIAFYSLYLLYPVTLDLIIPLNESRIRLIYYFTTFSHDRIMYLDILCFNITFLIILGVLSIACTETLIGVCSYYICILLKIISYRIQKIVTYLAMFKLSSKQIDSKLVELYRVVDIHNQAIEFTNVAINASAIHYIIASLLAVISLAINLHRLVSVSIIKKDQLEMSFCFMLVTIHLMVMFLNNYNGQILIDNSQQLFDELYVSLWYSIPLKAQKILLLIMLRSSTVCAFNLFGLFTPCYTGFSTVTCLNNYVTQHFNSTKTDENFYISDVKFVVFLFHSHIFDTIEIIICMTP
ncbi:uncharacterized protein LOC100866549 [Apis florea]|uniref:uncharacterized protein LOC100866549 n=1 Tax=Apis florea TaxID=7463 RepID=UPI0012FEBC2E|nr:uncharacterized protein LOC100866549 [Apis florea]